MEKEDKADDSTTDEEEGEEFPVYIYVHNHSQMNRNPTRSFNDIVGEEYTKVMVSEKTSVEALKSKVNELRGVPIEDQDIEFHPHRNLDGAQTLKHYGIGHSSEITVRIRVEGDKVGGRFQAAPANDRKNIPENTRLASPSATP